MTIPMMSSDASAAATLPAVTAAPVPEPREGATAATTADTSWDDLVAQVREAGLYPTEEQAERVTRAVLAALGEHVVGDERVDLARALPEEAGRIVAAQVPAHQAPAAAEFVNELSRRLPNATHATARWDTTSVLGVLPGLVGDDLTHRLLAQLPSGYALLFGQAELVRAA
ncbi:DUF2267 domain-containing protein [Streptomyces sp. NPDC056600]|uniref:DUF2267 domain-containing protein n=1 Tax=Streptomyces sp. NPDC056600 TaxID=3345874 RepID=UPI0036C7AE20